MALPGADGNRPICPACRSERVEALDTLYDITHRCLDCGAEFDDTGARVIP